MNGVAIFFGLLAAILVATSGSLADLIGILILGWIAYEAIKERF